MPFTLGESTLSKDFLGDVDIPASIVPRGTELLYPGRKPVGNVKIDRGHPFGKLVKTCQIAGQGSLINLQETLKVPLRTEFSGKSFDIQSVRTTISRGGEFSVGAIEGSLILVFKPDTITGNNIVLHTGNFSSFSTGLTIWSDSSGFNTSNSNCISINLEDSRFETEANTVSTTSYTFMVLSWGRGAINIYSKGRDILDFSESVPASITGSVTLGIGGTGSVLDEFDGALDFIACSNKSISQALTKSLSINPYQFLLPA